MPSLTNRWLIKELLLLGVIVGNTLHNNEAGEKGPSDSINNDSFLALLTLSFFFWIYAKASGAAKTKERRNEKQKIISREMFYSG